MLSTSCSVYFPSGYSASAAGPSTFVESPAAPELALGSIHFARTSSRQSSPYTFISLGPARASRRYPCSASLTLCSILLMYIHYIVTLKVLQPNLQFSPGSEVGSSTFVESPTSPEPSLQLSSRHAGNLYILLKFSSYNLTFRPNHQISKHLTLLTSLCAVVHQFYPISVAEVDPFLSSYFSL